MKINSRLTEWSPIERSAARGSFGSPGFSIRYPLALVIFTLFVLCIPRTGLASILGENLSASANISGIRSTVENETQTTQENVRQELNGNWFKNLSPYLSVYASVAYYKSDLSRSLKRSGQDTTQLDSTIIITDPYVTDERSLFKEQFSPSARLSLNHPLVRMSSSWTNTKSTGSLLSEELTRRNISFDLQTKMIDLPTLTAQYSRGRARDTKDHRGKNFADNSLGLGLSHYFGNWTARYRMSRTGSENLVTKYKSTAYRHTAQFQWHRAVFYKKPIKLSGSYLFNYSTRSDELPQDSLLRQIISPASGLHAQQQDAHYGWLNSETDLTDNDVTSPVDPPIDIGTNSTNQQLGVDLLISRTVSGLYIYTDRISDELLTWEIYSSSDGLEWTPVGGLPDIFFNAGINRYEIAFEQIDTRYIKAVSSGVNRIESVLVTEIVSLGSVGRGNEISQSTQSHRINVGATVQLNDQWKASSDLSYQQVPSVGLSGRRDNLIHSANASYRPTDQLTHSMRIQTSINNSSGDLSDFSDYLLSYNVLYAPLPTLKLTGSSSGRVSRSAGHREAESLNLSGVISASPIEDLSIEVQLGYGWDQYQSTDRRSDSWRARTSLDARPSRSLSFQLAYGYRTTDVLDGPEIPSQAELLFGLTIRPFRKIQISGQASKTIGRHRFIQRTLSANWSFTRTFTLSGQYRFSYDYDDHKSERKAVNLNWRMGARADIYVGFNKNELLGVHDSTESINAGLRIRL